MEKDAIKQKTKLPRAPLNAKKYPKVKIELLEDKKAEEAPEIVKDIPLDEIFRQSERSAQQKINKDNFDVYDENEYQKQGKGLSIVAMILGIIAIIAIVCLSMAIFEVFPTVN